MAKLTAMKRALFSVGTSVSKLAKKDIIDDSVHIYRNRDLMYRVIINNSGVKKLVYFRNG
jgi:hypothetical protein